MSTAKRRTPGNRRKPAARGKKTTPKAVAMAACVAAGVLVPLGIGIGLLDSYGQRARARKADAIVILGARVNQNGRAGHGLQMRVLHALRLYQKGFAPKIICTGGVGENPPAEAQVAARILLDKGVPRDDILLENKSTSTWQNAANASLICRARGWRRVLIVSDPFHLWRAERNFRRCGVLASGAPVAREEWQLQPTRKFLWTAREAILVARDWCLRRV